MSLNKTKIFIYWSAMLFLCLNSGLYGHIPVKNIIFMVPDGMGLSCVTAARIRKGGVDGSRLHMERLKEIGYQRTYSANSVITDSAAAASAWACGEKFNNGEISQHGPLGECPETILELAMSLGKSTGLIVTSTITHATPAAFGAHIHDRRCEHEIARQYINLGVDVLMGGGKSKFRTTSPDPCGVSGDFISLAHNLGYKVVFTEEQMNRINTPKLLGLFAENKMTPRYQRDKNNTTEPTLSEMTAKALSILDKNSFGFFLLVEGSQIDTANHANDIKYQIGETLDFDNAVKVVLNWVNLNPERKKGTLLVVVPDHECGGFSVNGPFNKILKKGEIIDPGWISDKHTGGDVIIWSQGPYSEQLGRAALDNTDLYYVMRAAFLGEKNGYE